MPSSLSLSESHIYILTSFNFNRIPSTASILPSGLWRAPLQAGMGKTWALITHLHAIAGPSLTLIYPLYASICAMESASKLHDGQWLAYWIIYSFIALFEMAAERALYWIPIWYEVKLLLVAWLVLPQFRGASFIYDKFVREQIRKHGVRLHHGHGHDAGHGVHVLKAEHGVH